MAVLGPLPQLLQHGVRRRAADSQFLQAPQGNVGRTLLRSRFGQQVGGNVTAQAGSADRRGQGEALADQRGQNHHQGQEMIAARCGNGAPASVVSGSPKAAARETTPLIPAHKITAGTCHGGDGSRVRTRRLSSRGRYVAESTPTNRVSTTAAVTAIAAPANSPADEGSSDSTSSGG